MPVKAIICVGKAYGFLACDWTGCISVIFDNQQLTRVGTTSAYVMAASLHGAWE
jgi:hypothetical protein